MLLKRKSILCFVIIHTLISISYETPAGTGNAPHEEVNESDIENVITKKDEEETEKKDTFKENKNDNENTSQKIKKLEEEKGELYKQINKAIDESVILLEYTNDTEAKLGIQFMNDLKSQLNEINRTDINIDGKKGSIQRRSRIGDSRKHIKKKVKITYQEIADLFKGSGNSSKKAQEANDSEMKKKIDDWILQRQLEKNKILDYKKKRIRIKQEDCPRLGDGKKKIKVNGESRKAYMPCCRKCCKMSYMGCL